MAAKPGQTGDQAHLPWGSIRWSLARQMRVVVITHEGPPHGQYAALLSGADVQVSADQVRAMVPPDKRPAAVDLDRHPVWVLRGDDDLRPLT